MAVVTVLDSLMLLTHTGTRLLGQQICGHQGSMAKHQLKIPPAIKLIDLVPQPDGYTGSPARSLKKFARDGISFVPPIFLSKAHLRGIG